MTSIYNGSLEAWAVLLDRVSDGGLEINVIVTDEGYGYLAFDICHSEVTPDAVSAAHALTRLFNLGGFECREIVETCLSVGEVAFKTHKTEIEFKGPAEDLAHFREASRGAR